MKKLIIAAAIVCAAAYTQAASVTWDVVVPEMDSYYSPAVGTLVLATGAQSWDFTFNEEGTASGSIVGDTTGIFAADTAWTATITAALIDDDGNPAGDWTKSYAFTMPTIPADPTQAGAAFSGINDAITAAFQSGETGAMPSSSVAASEGWAAVPEPTSGLLLLLGVAGLALRRRRA